MIKMDEFVINCKRGEIIQHYIQLIIFSNIIFNNKTYK